MNSSISDIIFPNNQILFDQESYRRVNDVKDIFHFSRERVERKADITFSLFGKEAISLPQTPYAGFYLSGTWNQSHLKTMLQQLCENLAAKDIENIVIKQRPSFAISMNAALLHEALSEFGFSYLAETNHHVPLDHPEKLKIHHMQDRKIMKCGKSGLEFREETPENVSEIYAFIKKCRIQQDLQINISLEKLSKLVDKLPNLYQMFCVRNTEGELYAATVIVHLNESLAYNFLPAFDRKYKAYSPLSFLLYHLYEYLHLAHYRILDLGISSLEGDLQTGLALYKERMGGILTNRYSYVISLK